MPAYFLTGTNRGLGLEFTRQLCARGDTVYAATRSSSEATELMGLAATIVPLDLSQPDQIAALRERMSGLPLDVLINNAGISSSVRRLELLSATDLEQAFKINAIAPLLVAKALMPSLIEGRLKRIVNISSGKASIARNTRDPAGGSSYAYRGSKAALNMLTSCLSNEMYDKGFTCVAIDPGWSSTDMGGSKAPLTPAMSVKRLLQVIDGLHSSRTGAYLNLDDRSMPW